MESLPRQPADKQGDKWAAQHTPMFGPNGVLSPLELYRAIDHHPGHTLVTCPGRIGLQVRHTFNPILLTGVGAIIPHVGLYIPNKFMVPSLTIIFSFLFFDT